MPIPGFNSFWYLSEEVIGTLTDSPPLTVGEILDRLGGPGRRKVYLDYKTHVPLTEDHIALVLRDYLEGYAQESAGRWSLAGPRPPLPPIWKTFPYPWGSMGYRMGGGEDYWVKWMRWYRALEEAAREEYQRRNPEPPSWRHFYRTFDRDPRDEDERQRIREDRYRAEEEYVAAEYQAARECEEAGKVDEALYHYHEVIERGGHLTFPDAETRYEALRQREVK